MTATKADLGTGDARSLVSLLNRAAERFPDRRGLIDTTGSLTWAEVREAVDTGALSGTGSGPVARTLAGLSDLARGKVVSFTQTKAPLPPRADLVFAATLPDGQAGAVCHASADAARIGTALARREALTEADRIALAAPVATADFWSVLAACMASGAALDLSCDIKTATTAWLNEPEAVTGYQPQPHLKRLHLRAGRDRLAEVAAAQPGTRIVNGLSLPETLGLALSSDPRDPAATVTATAGRPLDGVEVMIVDPRTGMDMLLYQTGEVWLRGTGIALGYAGHPGVGFTDRFFRTGILGHLDSEGRLVLPRAEEAALLIDQR